MSKTAKKTFLAKKRQKNLHTPKILLNFAPQLRETPIVNDSVAQLVEQLTLNQWVESSSLSGVTIKNGKTPQNAEII